MHDVQQNYNTHFQLSEWEDENNIFPQTNLKLQ